MGVQASSYYDAHAQSVDLTEITSSNHNAWILRRLRDNDPEMDMLWIEQVQQDDAWDGDSDFVVGDGDDLGWLGYFIGRNTTLLDLYIYDLPEDKRRILAFIRELVSNRSLMSLNISTNLGEGFQSLDSLLKNGSLIEITFETRRQRFDIDVQCARNIAFMLDQPDHCNALKTLLFHNISDEAMVEITPSMRAHPQLEEIHLNGRNGRVVFNGLSCVPLLKRLTLEGNSLDNERMTALVTGLANLQSLEELHLRNNSIGDEGLQTLAEGTGNLSLSCLNLSSNQSITAAGLSSLSPMLQSESCSLTSLILDGIPFNDDMAAVLTGALKGNKSLTKLLFEEDSNNLTSVGWSAFSKLLCDTSSVNNTYLSNHMLKSMSGYYTHRALRQLLNLNLQRDKPVAICKILKYHPDFDVGPFLRDEWELKLLPLVMSWFVRVRGISEELENAPGRAERIRKILVESEEEIEKRQLSTSTTLSVVCLSRQLMAAVATQLDKSYRNRRSGAVVTLGTRRKGSTC